jgi:hypothetical protein
MPSVLNLLHERTQTRTKTVKLKNSGAQTAVTIEPHADRPQKVTLGGDKGFDTQDFVAELRDINVTAHVAQNTNGRRSAIDGRTTRHAGYAISLRIRKRIEEAFGWAKTVAGLRKARHRGLPKVDWQFTFAMAAYNLVRLPKLLVVAASCRDSVLSEPTGPKSHSKYLCPGAGSVENILAR